MLENSSLALLLVLIRFGEVRDFVQLQLFIEVINIRWTQRAAVYKRLL